MAPSVNDSRRSETAGDSPLRRVSKMPLVGERLSPWLLAAVVAAGVNLLVLLRDPNTSTGHGTLLLLLAAVLTASGLVAARSGCALAAIVSEERARPATEELEYLDGKVGSSRYVQGMRDWASAMLELIEHARELTDASDPSFVELSAASDDTEAVLELLGSVAEDTHLTLSDRAVLHAVCALWETTQPTVERLAAQVDRHWHRRWRARSVVVARLRHGIPERQTFALPFRT